MNKLRISPRMELLCSLVCGNSAADIGTDHGMVPAELITSGRCSRVILTDVQQGPLGKAVSNIRDLGLDNIITDFRLGSGLQPLKPAEADSVIIAGMGGELICSILEEDKQKSFSFKKLILQPRSKSEVLRRWLINNNYFIVNYLVEEDQRLCFVIEASQDKAYLAAECTFPMQASEDELLYPPDLALSSPRLYRRYISYQCAKQQEILDSLEKAVPTQDSRARAMTARRRLGYLETRITDA